MENTTKTGTASNPETATRKIAETVSGVQHVGLPTSCFEKTVEFYKSLAFEVIYSTVLHGTQHVAFLKQGNLVIETYEDNAAGKAGAWDHVALDCSDIDAAFEAVNALGYEVVSNGIEELPFWNNGDRFFTFLGPNSEKVEFNQIL